MPCSPTASRRHQVATAQSIGMHTNEKSNYKTKPSEGERPHGHKQAGLANRLARTEKATYIIKQSTQIANFDRPQLRTDGDEVPVDKTKHQTRKPTTSHHSHMTFLSYCTAIFQGRGNKPGIGAKTESNGFYIREHKTRWGGQSGPKLC